MECTENASAIPADGPVGRFTLVELLPKTTRRSDHGGIGELCDLAMDASTLAKSIAALEAEQWRSSVLWDRARNVVERKCAAELFETGARSDGRKG